MLKKFSSIFKNKKLHKVIAFSTICTLSYSYCQEIPINWIPSSNLIIIFKEKEGMKMLSRSLNYISDENKKYTGYLEMITKGENFNQTIFGSSDFLFSNSFLMASGTNIMQTLFLHYPKIQQYLQDKQENPHLEFFKVLPGSYWITSLDKKLKKLGNDILLVSLDESKKDEMKERINETYQSNQQITPLFQNLYNSSDYHFALYAKIPKDQPEIKFFLMNLSDFDEFIFKISKSDTNFTTLSFKGKLANGIEGNDAQKRFKIILSTLFSIISENDKNLDYDFLKNLFPIQKEGEFIVISGVLPPRITKTIFELEEK